MAETPEKPIDYEFAQQELMIEEMGNDPIQDAILTIEKEHEKDKEGKRQKEQERERQRERERDKEREESGKY